MRQTGLTALLLLAVGCGETHRTVPPVPPAPAASQQPTQTGSAAMAVVAVGSQLKAYVPAGQDADGHYRIWVVDAAQVANGTSGYLGTIDLGAGTDVLAVAATDGLVIAISGGSPSIWFIDPATDQVLSQLALPDTFPSWDVSKQANFMSGVVIDPVRRRAYVGVWSGFRIIDIDTREFAGDLLVAPSENFGFDPQRNRLVAPFYKCPDPSLGTSPPPPCSTYLSPDGTLITDGINVVDLATSKVFTYVDETPGVDQSMPAGQYPDAAAVDPTSGRAIVPVEAPWQSLVLDLAGATYDVAKATFTASKVVLVTPPEMTGVAVEPGSGIGIGTQENDGGSIALYDLQAITADATANLAFLPELPWGAGIWIGNGDPHNVVAGLLDGKPVAWMVNGAHTWLARIDLTLLQELGTAAPPGGIDPATLAPAVTYTFMPPAP